MSWTLSSLDMTTNDTSILHVSVYYNRAFLCLQHQNDTQKPTFIEATWPENLIGVKPKIFPSESQFKKRSGKCRGIQQGKATDIDEKGRLWLIDEGTDKCAPKIFVYDLLYFNEEVHFMAFDLLLGKKFSKIVVDPVQCENGDTRAYISLYGQDYLLVYSMNERKIGKLKFTNEYIQPSKSLSFTEMLITQQKDQMYITDSSTGNLYSMNLTPIRYLNFSIVESKKMSIRSPLTYIGALLGPAKSLTSNSDGVVLYIIPKFSTVVMWDPRTPLTAEWHEVIYQTTDDLSQILCGQKGSVYVINEKVVKITRTGNWKHAVKIHVA
ncbi:uncharacterized protein yellow-k [Chironomus tepperi]|uniref:uncharacterized protein yellow-k n=1 Tax=Chironomus tepperi TaxID=113505 RepID=UPI00391F9657